MLKRPWLHGFTMLELSIVLIIIAMITGMGIVATLGVMESAKLSSTEAKMNEIERALMAFRNKHNRLPCPAQIDLLKSSANYGVEAAGPGNCLSGTPVASQMDAYGAEGTVPIKALNLPESYMYDGWGRKIAYAVDINATYANAFATIKPGEFCEITVQDLSGTAITGNGTYTAGAVYALLSHGPNGTAGYITNTRNGGATDANKQINCHCDAVGAPLDIVTHAVYAQGQATATFDDIVRYKERWQMQNEDDGRNFSTYRGPEMAISLTHNALNANRIQLFEKQCGQWKPFTGGLPATFPVSATAVTGLAFTPSNGYLFAYKNGDCYVYNIDRSYVGAASLGTAETLLTCPAYAAGNVSALSTNGYLAITQSAAPYIKLWKQSGRQFFSFPDTAPAVSVSPALTTVATRIAMSGKGNYMAVGGATYIHAFARTDNTTYTRITNPASAPANPASISFTTDERYFAAASPASTTFRIWTLDSLTNAFSAATAPAGVITNITAIRFSPDGKYLAVVGGGPGGLGVAVATHIMVYKIDGTTYTQITPGGVYTYTGTAYTDIAFSPDSEFIIAPFTGGSDSTRATILRRTATDAFTLVSPLIFSLNAGESPLLVRFAH